MLYLFVGLCVVYVLCVRRHLALGLVVLSSLASPLAASGCLVDETRTSVVQPTVVAGVQISQERIRNVCYLPPKQDPDTTHFVILDGDKGEVVSDQDEAAFATAVVGVGFVYKYDLFAPVANLSLIPLTHPEPWCTRVPRPTDERILRLLHPCSGAKEHEEGRAAAKNLPGQTVAVRSPYYCGQEPQMARTTALTMLIRERNEAYQKAYDYAHATAKALTLAEAEMQRVLNNDDSWLKQAFTGDPGKLEDIQQRATDALNSIEEPAEYNHPIFDGIAAAGYKAGFDEGKFEVEAKLFAIDAGVMLIEFAAMEVALGPLGGAKLLGSALSKGTKALTTAVKRLENIPIFLPVGMGGGGVVRAGAVMASISARMHSYNLEKALRLAPKPFRAIREAGQALHHMVAHGDGRAAAARKILDKFKVNIDEFWNGVYLPRYKNSPNPNGSIVHAVVHTDEYYLRVERFLGKPKSRKDVIRALKRMRETLENGTFFDVPL